MGIRNILKIIPEQISFNESKMVEFFKYLGIKKIAVDGNSELYRYFVKNNGNIRFIDEIENDIKERMENGIEEVWVFDHLSKNSFHIPEKQQEIKRRKRNYMKNRQMLEHYKKEFISRNDELTNKILENKINILKKRILKPKQFHFDKLRNLLASYSIVYMNAIEGYEGEHIASILSNTKYEDEFVVDAVLSGDSDIVVYKARNSFIRRDNMIKYYNFKQICKDLNINHRLLVNCAVVLGTDFNHPVIQNMRNIRNITFKDIMNIIQSNAYESVFEELQYVHNIYRRDIDLSEFYNMAVLSKKNMFSLI